MPTKEKIENFTDLTAWKKAHKLVLFVYENTREFPKDETYGIITEFNQWSNQFTEIYKPLFEPDVEDDYDRDDLDEEELAELAEIEAQEAVMNKWGWERLILSLADGDILRTEDALKMGLVHTFNLLSMKKELNID